MTEEEFRRLVAGIRLQGDGEYVLRRRLVDEASYATIAEETGRSEGALHVQVYRLRVTIYAYHEARRASTESADLWEEARQLQAAMRGPAAWRPRAALDPQEGDRDTVCASVLILEDYRRVIEVGKRRRREL